MKYFRVVNPEDVTDEFYVSCDRDDFPLDLVKEHLGLQMYCMTECSKEEYETMTQEENDCILDVGHQRGELTLYASAPTPEEAVNALALDLRKIWECIESEFIWV